MPNIADPTAVRFVGAFRRREALLEAIVDAERFFEEAASAFDRMVPEPPAALFGMPRSDWLSREGFPRWSDRRTGGHYFDVACCRAILDGRLDAYVQPGAPARARVALRKHLMERAARNLPIARAWEDAVDEARHKSGAAAADAALIRLLREAKEAGVALRSHLPRC